MKTFKYSAAILSFLGFIFAANLASAASSNSINIRFAPVNLVVGMVSVEADFGIGDHLTVGPSVTSWNVSLPGTSWSATSYGLRAKWFFDNSFADGFYVSPVVYSSNWSMTVLGSTAKQSTTNYGAFGGYQWIWESFNQNLGLGYVASSETQITAIDGSKKTIPTQLNLEYWLGWAF